MVEGIDTNVGNYIATLPMEVGVHSAGVMYTDMLFPVSTANLARLLKGMEYVYMISLHRELFQIFVSQLLTTQYQSSPPSPSPTAPGPC